MRFKLVHRHVLQPVWHPVVTSVHIEGNTLADLAAMAETGMADYAETFADTWVDELLTPDGNGTVDYCVVDGMAVGVALAIDALASLPDFDALPRFALGVLGIEIAIADSERPNALPA